MLLSRSTLSVKLTHAECSAGMGVKADEVEKVLESVGFGEEMRAKPISSLSGGWKMKLALGACPTPHSFGPRCHCASVRFL